MYNIYICIGIDSSVFVALGLDELGNRVVVHILPQQAFWRTRLRLLLTQHL